MEFKRLRSIKITLFLLLLGLLFFIAQGSEIASRYFAASGIMFLLTIIAWIRWLLISRHILIVKNRHVSFNKELLTK